MACCSLRGLEWSARLARPRVLQLARPAASRPAASRPAVCAACCLRGLRPVRPPLSTHTRARRASGLPACGLSASRPLQPPTCCLLACGLSAYGHLTCSLAVCVAYGLRGSRTLPLEGGLSQSRPAASRPSALRPACAACGLSARGFSASRPALPALASRPSRRAPRVSCLVAAVSRGMAVPSQLGEGVGRSRRWPRARGSSEVWPMHLVVGGLLPSRAIRPYPQPGEGVGQNQSLASGSGGDPWSQASAPCALWADDAI